MTTRNFRVNNGLEVGDIVISASANTITGGATAAPSADGQFANKKYVDDQAAATLTLTNKTLTAPKIADAGFIADANGNESVIFQTTTSAVNELEITNAATGNGPILGASGETNVDLNITAKGTGNILLNAGSDVVIPANKGLQFVDANEKIESDGTDLTINSGAKINLTATSDVAIPANIGITFGTHEKIESDDTDLTITVGANGDVNLGADIGLTFGDDGEKIEGNGTKLTIASSDAIDLTATTDVVIPANVGLTFGTGEKIEGDSTDLTVTSGGAINLTATTDVVVPANVGITFGTGEKIEGDSTDLTVTSGGAINLTATTDVVIPANVGITFGTGEKIEGDSTDLTVTSGAKINLAATSDVHIPQNIGLVFDANGTEKIESNDTDLTINSGAKINLTAVSDVHIPKNIGIVFDDNASEKIESNDTDLTISSGAKIKLSATSDVEIPNNVGIAYGTAGEKIESDGTDLTVTSTGVLNLTATGDTAITNNATIGGNLVLTGNLTVNGSTSTVSSVNTTIADNIIELNTGISASSNDAGIIIERGSTGNNAAILWDESADKFTMGTTTATAADKSGGVSVSVSTLVANLEGNVTGDVTGTADVATAITAADESSDTSCNVLFVTGATGDLPPKTGTNLTFNSSSGVLTATGFAGALTGNVTGTADVATVATTVTITDNESTNENNAMIFTAGGDVDGGNLGLESDGTCTYNPSTGKITATGFVGDLTGTASAAEYSDVAERFASDSVYAPGTVVALGGAEEITQVNEEASDEVFGVVSGEHQAAFKMNAGAGSDDSHPFVAMTGRVDVKVIGTVNKGDRLVSASVPGYAKSAQKSECTAFNVIGRALTSKTTAGQGSVLAAVRVSH